MSTRTDRVLGTWDIEVYSSLEMYSEVPERLSVTVNRFAQLPISLLFDHRTSCSTVVLQHTQDFFPTHHPPLITRLGPSEGCFAEGIFIA